MSKKLSNITDEDRVVRRLAALPKKQLTKDEEADEIVRRLSAPPTKGRKVLEASWTMDMVETLKTQHGIDIEIELAAILAEEIDKEILEQLRTPGYGKRTI